MPRSSLQHPSGSASTSARIGSCWYQYSSCAYCWQLLPWYWRLYPLLKVSGYVGPSTTLRRPILQLDVLRTDRRRDRRNISFRRTSSVFPFHSQSLERICGYLQVLRCVSFEDIDGTLLLACLHVSHSGNNHTVTQSSFSSPCQPLSGGFDSGFIYIPSGVKSGFPEWNLTITDDSTRK